MVEVAPESRVAYPRRIFCNRNLRLDRIRHIGFDMDYTLALYEESMEHLQAEMVLERMVKGFGYPEVILQAKYQPDFAIRGLGVDMAHGNVFKMDSHRFVGRVWHGKGPLDKEIRKRIYTNRKLSPADPSIMMVDTLFSLPEISLYCQLVAIIDKINEANHSNGKSIGLTYERLWRDLRHAMDELHRDGTLKARILADVPRFIRRDKSLAETLHRFRSAGKRLFVLTNSEPHYTEAVMTHLLTGQHPAYPTWRDFFDLVITSAKKPMFFGCDDPFLEVDEALNLTGEAATTLRRGGLYVGGNVQDLSRMFGLVGDDVLYVGDHIYGDILRSKRSTSWRTAMVVPEMERELERTTQHLGEVHELEQLEESVFQLELDRSALAMDGIRNQELNAQIKDMNTRAKELEAKIADAFNPAWGQLFRDRAELSAFGAQVEDYACVYTGRVSNFRFYSPSFYFRSPRDRMAHELGR
jgi:5'-nucleotidase